MRNAYVSAIYKARKRSSDVVCIVGDIGAYLLRNYIKDFPESYLNLGAAEANMVGVAAGLAMSGKIPFVYGITPFVTERCYEQIKLDVCYNGANVKFVGVGSGISYGTMGSTHHTLGDIAIMRALPDMVVLSPSTKQEIEEAVLAAAAHKGPVYIRLGLNVLTTESGPGKFKIGKARIVKKGKDVAILATGDMVGISLDAARVLEKDNIQCFVVNFHTLKPIDETLIKSLSRKCKVVVTIEEHSTIGGFGSAVASILSQYPKNSARFKMIGTGDVFVREYSSDKLKLFEEYGLSTKHLVKTIRNLLSA